MKTLAVWAGSWVVVSGLAAVLPAPNVLAEAWQEPAHWSEAGAVREWKDVDSKFYRVHQVSLSVDESQFAHDQAGQYARTRQYRGSLDGIGLEAWQSLAPEEQTRRTGAARDELKFLVAFRLRLLNQAQNTRMELPSGWGARISDRTVVGEALGKLSTAAGLDPSNPYVWHLYSYFASLVGDDRRALAAVEGAEAALGLVPDEALAALRSELALDKAWLLRDRGEFAAARASLDEAVAHGAAGPETQLLRGLLAAQTGDDRTALTMAAELRRTEVAAFAPNARSAGFAPEIANVEAWPRRTSSYLADWIKAFTWLRAGRPDLAATAFGPQNLNDQRPFAHRFWQEAGAIYEVTGRRGLALQAWRQAEVTAPYLPYLVYQRYSCSLGNLTGRGGPLPYTLGFDSCFLQGSRLAYGAALVNELVSATGEQRRHELAARALDQLEICQRFGLYPGQALILQGQVYYLMEDAGAATAAVDEALRTLDAAGDKSGLAAVLRGLGRSPGELAPQDLANFYGQGGRSGGRWQEDTDPATTLLNLRAAHAADRDDGSRRDLARGLIRNGELDEGRRLALVPLGGSQPSAANLAQLPAADLELVLEADRAAGDSTVAGLMVQILQNGGEDPWCTAAVWALAGFICLDQDQRAAGRLALERAVELDPGNHGLKVQLSLM